MKPILFNTEMVRAILEGRKTVTRRVVKFQLGRNPLWSGYVVDGLTLYNGRNEPCNVPAPYKVGDILYVRETWNEWQDGYVYKACSPFPQVGAYGQWKPSIHMPKEAARIFLKVTDVRVERLQDINEKQAKKEGCVDDIEYCVGKSAREHFKELWDSTIKPDQLDIYGWEANPYVWVIALKRVSKPAEEA